MTEKFLKYLVYLLSILILFAFIGVLYGVYIKTSSKSLKKYNSYEDISLNLESNYKIVKIDVIDSSRLLIIISYENEFQGLIYDIKEKNIIQKIYK